MYFKFETRKKILADFCWPTVSLPAKEEVVRSFWIGNQRMSPALIKPWTNWFLLSGLNPRDPFQHFGGKKKRENFTVRCPTLRSPLLFSAAQSHVATRCFNECFSHMGGFGHPIEPESIPNIRFRFTEHYNFRSQKIMILWYHICYFPRLPKKKQNLTGTFPKKKMTASCFPPKKKLTDQFSLLGLQNCQELKRCCNCFDDQKPGFVDGSFWSELKVCPQLC